MVVAMPYGSVKIFDKDKAQDFVINYCLLCPYNSEPNKCTKEKAARCNEKVQLVALVFKDELTIEGTK